MLESGFRGGVHLATDGAEAERVAAALCGHTLVTKQTGERGRPISGVLVADRVFARRESYFAVLLERQEGSAGAVCVASARGGMNIEEVAAEEPEAIIRVRASLDEPLGDERAAALAAGLGMPGNAQAEEQVKRMFDLFRARDMTQLEINPLVEAADGAVLAVDAKLAIDDNAEFRQGDLFALHDTTQDEPRDVEAAKHDLNFISLDGNVGSMVNGAGLAMATCDLLNKHGGSPANFLDVGGGATEEQVEHALRLIADDKRVRSILVNIFGGIMKCDTIAAGLVAALETLKLDVPVVVRLQGTNMEQAKAIIDDAGVDIIYEPDFDAAATKAVKLADAVDLARAAGVQLSFKRAPAVVERPDKHDVVIGQTA